MAMQLSIPQQDVTVTIEGDDTMICQSDAPSTISRLRLDQRAGTSSTNSTLWVTAIAYTDDHLIATHAERHLQQLIEGSESNGGADLSDLSQALGVQVLAVQPPIVTVEAVSAPPQPPFPPRFPSDEWMTAEGIQGIASATFFSGAIVASGPQASVEIVDCTFIDLHARLGGALTVVNGAKATVRASIFANNTAVLGGAVYVNQATLRVASTTIMHNRAEVEGGGVYMASGSLLLGDRTRIAQNWAPTGRQASFLSGTAQYFLPAPLGCWVAAPIECRVYRQPCPLSNSSCDLASQPPLAHQPCDHGTHAEMLGLQLSAFALAPLEDDYPYECDEGYQGISYLVDEQSGPSCSRQCPAGYYCPGGTSEPTLCPKGHFCEVGSASPSVCPAGTYSNQLGLRQREGCQSSRPGHWASAGVEVACEVGYFQEAYGASHEGLCTQCPQDATTRASTSVSRTDCLCRQGFYATVNDIDNMTVCHVCPPGSDCQSANASTEGIHLSSLPIRVGHWRLDVDTPDVRICPDANVNCSDDAPACPESTSGCQGSVGLGWESQQFHRRSEASGAPEVANLLCRPGLAGIFCLQCDRSNVSAGVYYASATSSSYATCKPCGDLVVVVVVSSIGGVLALSVLLWFAHQQLPSRLSRHRKEYLHHLERKLKPVNKLKQLFSFYVIASRVPSVYEVTFPNNMQRLSNFFRTVVSLGLAGVRTPLECFGLGTYMHELLFWLIAPVAVGTLVLVAAVGRQAQLHSQRRRGPALSERPASHGAKSPTLGELALPALLRLGFVSYPTITNVAFEAFSCYEFERKAYLKADVAVECYTPEHQLVRSIAWVAVIIYPVGLLALNGALLFRARHAIQLGRPSKLSRSISFLHSEYEPHLFFWELVEMLRRLVLVGMMVLMQGNILQIILGTLLSLVFLLLQLQAQPFNDPLDDYLASSSSFGLVALFICAYAFKQEALLDSPGMQSRLSAEQRRVYVSVHHSLLTATLFASLLSALLMLSVIVALQVTHEGRRLRSQARAAKARRLRRLHTHEDAVPAPLPLSSHLPAWLPPVLELGPFHLFLSHNWVHGQAEMRIVKARLTEMLPDIEVFLDVDALGRTNLRDYEHIDVSSWTLCFVTTSFLRSGPCSRELLRAVLLRKPLLAMLQSDEERGGLTEREVRELLTDKWIEEPKFRAGKTFDLRELVADWADEWERPGLVCPTAHQVRDALFASVPIVWYSIASLQDVTMRVLAERMLPGGERPYDASPYQQMAYMQGEIAQQHERSPITMPFKPRRRFHLYVSVHNPGAMEVADALHALAPSLEVSSWRPHLERCEQMLIYLTSRTWTTEGASERLAGEVAQAMQAGVRLMLAHEVMGARLGDDARHGCVFASLFEVTPQRLLQAGIYNCMIAMPLAGDEWRDAGLIALAQSVARGGGDREQWRIDGMDVADDPEGSKPSNKGSSRTSTRSVGGRPSLRLRHTVRHSSGSLDKSSASLTRMRMHQPPPPGVGALAATKGRTRTAKVMPLNAHVYEGERLTERSSLAFGEPASSGRSSIPMELSNPARASGAILP